MGEDFLKKYSEVAKQVKADPASVDLREFIRDELDGCLFFVLFNQQGRAFAGYYYGEGDSPHYPADVDDNALRFFGDVYKRQGHKSIRARRRAGCTGHPQK